jgi:prepilin-type N-terminal cleavage/methylation domain-containing protein
MNVMKIFSPARRSRLAAFTLIELLVVISIIAVLAALLIPITHGLKNQRMRRVAYAELAQMETAIESYKAKTGFYPPDNPGNPGTNQLFFELSGTLLNNVMYTTIDGSGQIPATTAAFDSALAPNTGKVSGFANSSTSVGGSDDKPAPLNFFRDSHLKPNQTGFLPNGLIPPEGFKILVCSVGWSGPLTSPTGSDLAPWQYRSTSPVNNPGSFDLWVDLPIDGKTNRIGNWSKQSQIVP